MASVHPLLAGVSAFLASLVEFVEALTIVLAVGVAGGWRAALLGAAAGVALLLVLIAAFGGSLAAVREGVLHLVVGSLLLFFGIRWLRKACLRAAGAIPLHDEDQAFAGARNALGSGGRAHAVFWGTLGTAFNAVVLEGIEVVFIVLALGSTAHALAPAGVGAAVAFVAVVAVGVAVHRPLSRVPENALKLAVGVMLTAFGTFWLAEAFGASWPWGDGALIVLVAGYALAAAAAIGFARRVERTA